MNGDCKAVRGFITCLTIILGLQIILYHLLNGSTNLELTFTNQLTNDRVQYTNKNKLCIDIFTCLENSNRPGLYTLINSVLINLNDTNNNSCIYIHILVEKQFELSIFEKELNVLFSTELKTGKFIFELKSFDSYPIFYSFIENKTRCPIWSRRRKYTLWNQKMAWARIWLPKIFKNIEKVIYVDIDIIVETDISKLYAYDTTNVPIWFVFKPDLRLTGVIDDLTDIEAIKVFGIYDNMLSDNAESFNAGVGLFNLTYWRQNNITERCENIIVLNKNIAKRNLIKFGDQSVLNIAFIQIKKQSNITIGHLDQRWNIGDLGWSNNKNKLEMKQGYILHWNGKHKPWLKKKKGSLYVEYWSKYIPSKFNHNTVNNWSTNWMHHNLMQQQ